MARKINEERFLIKMRAFIDEKYKGNNSEAARAWNCSRGHVGNVLAGIKPPTDNMLTDMELIRMVQTEIWYEKL